MENRSIFAFEAIPGMLIATLLLLSILAGLTVWGIAVQQANAATYYTIENAKDIKMIDATSAKHVVVHK
ncbi:MAG: DUF4006 family protein [Campylobacterota bacterium]|nr:DUF4006 family protein [Campylobacterota bacterium]